MRPYLSSASIARLAHFQMVARMVVEGTVSGQHRSPHFGFNVEFSHHRPYMPGDELKHLDWKLYAKSDKYYVKQYEESTRLTAQILLDASGSMAYSGAGATSKLLHGKLLTAALAYLMLHQRDAVGVATFRDRLCAKVAPRAHPMHLHRILECIHVTQGESGTDVFRVVQETAAASRRRSLVIVISDLLDEGRRILDGVSYLRYLKNEVVLMQVLTPEEIEFPFDTYTRFEDLEDGSRLSVEPRYLAREYRQEFGAFLDELSGQCRFLGIDYALMRTDVPVEESLGRYLRQRQWGGRA